jgi:hydrogenase nickel incorporation protein HypA/HybF
MRNEFDPQGAKPMNETSVAHGLLDDIQKESKRHGVSRISRVHVRMGRDCSIVPEELASAFKDASEGTMAEGAELNIGVVGSKARCDTCDIEFAVDLIKATVFTCPQCGGKAGKLISGKGLEVALLRGKMPPQS